MNNCQSEATKTDVKIKKRNLEELFFFKKKSEDGTLVIAVTGIRSKIGDVSQTILRTKWNKIKEVLCKRKFMKQLMEKITGSKKA